MNTQLDRNLDRASAGRTGHTPLRIEAGHSVHLGRLGGELSVLQGRVWLTRDGDLGDHLVEPGQRVRLAVGEHGVVESVDADRSAVFRWNPRRQTFVGAVLAEPLRGLAFLTGVAARAFAALARKAADSACRAQGSISAGDSMASPGALK